MLKTNPMILCRIEESNIPSKVKELVYQILKIENAMEAENATSDYRSNIEKILEQYVDDPEVKEFCKKYE